MRSRSAGSLALCALLAAAVALFLQQTLSLGPAARSVPLKVCVPTLALVLLQLALELLPGLARRLAILERRELIGVRSVREQIHPEHLRVREHPTAEDPALPRASEGAAFAWMGAMLASAALLGFLAGGPLFALAYLRLHGRRRWGVSLAVSGGLLFFLVAVFDGVFDAPLFRGWLFMWLDL